MAPKMAVKGKGVAKGKDVKKDIKKDNKGKFEKKDRDIGMVAADVEVDEDARYDGTVDFFERRRGFGFIKPDQDGLVPDNKIMVVWKEIQSDDRWPFLNKDQKVEFGIKKFVKKNETGAFLKAKEVTLPGGERIALQEEQEDRREYVGGDKNLRYEGTVVWFDWRKGFGFVKIEDGYEVPDEMPKEIRVHREEVSCDANSTPHLRDGATVEFGISKNKSGKYGVFNLTLPGGDPVTMASFLQRVEVTPPKEYTGEVKSFMGGFGWIEMDDTDSLPAAVKAKLTESTEKRSKRSGGDAKDAWLYCYREDVKTDVYVDRGQKCKFKVHTSDKGVGASDVEIIQ